MNKASKAARIVSHVCASMSAEGFRVDEDTRRACMAVAVGEKSASELIRSRLAEKKLSIE